MALSLVTHGDDVDGKGEDDDGGGQDLVIRATKKVKNYFTRKTRLKLENVETTAAKMVSQTDKSASE